MSPRLALGTRVYVHDPARKGIIYRRGYVIDTTLLSPPPQYLYDIIVSKGVVRGLIREQLLTEQEMVARRAQGI